MTDKVSKDLGPRSISRADIIFFAAVFLFLYTQLFQFPWTPIYLDGDHLIPVSNAMRLLDGEVMYRDFFHITPPGTELWYAALFSIFGIRVWVLHFTILLLNMALVWLAWHFSRQFFSGLLVYLAPTILLIAGIRLFLIDGSYRLFSVVFALAAVAVLMRKRAPLNLMLAGVLCGLASFFVQPRGIVALAGIAIFLIWEHLRREPREKSLAKTGLFLFLPSIATVVATHGYFLLNAGFDNYYFSLVTFLQKHYASDPLSSGSAFLADVPSLQQYLTLYPTPAAVFRYIRIAVPTLFFYSLVPWAYLAFFVYRWRRRSYLENDAQDRKLVLLCIVGLVLGAGVSAPSAFRLSHVALPAIVILVWFFGHLKHANRIAAVVLSVSAVIGVAYVVQRQSAAYYFLEMPAGRAAFVAEFNFQRHKWMAENTRPGDVFYEGHHPTFYFPFHLKNPTPMYVIRDNDYSPQFQVDSVLHSLEKNPPEFIVWPRKWTKPAEDRLPHDHLENLCRFVHANYEFYVVFEKPVDYTPYSEGDIEIWKRKH